METRPQLSIIIINYQSANYIQLCLDSFQVALSSLNHEIIIVNNDPTEQDFSFIAVDKIISLKRNMGFSFAANIGARQASGDMLLFLNPDTTFEFGNFTTLMDHLKNNKPVGIIGLQLTNAFGEKELENYGEKITPLQLIRNNIFPKKNTPTTVSRAVDWVSGGALLIKKYAFEKLEGFDEHFFMYYEDVDLCFRAKKLGFSVIFWPAISFHHAAGKSFNNIQEQKKFYYQSQHYYFQKHFGKLTAFFIDILRKLTHHKRY